MMHGYWEQLQALMSSGRPFVSVTLVDVVASAPADVGAKMLVTAEGLFHGTVGGGKIEARALKEAGEMLRMAPSPAPRMVEWNLQREIGMTCGGSVRLFFEVYNVSRWPIVIFGAGHCAQALVRLLLTLRCDVTVIDPRAEWLEKLPRDGRLRAVHAVKEPRLYVPEIPAGAFVLLMTMGHSSDQPILIDILKERARDFGYLGVIGSEAKAGALARGLKAAGIGEELATPGNAYLCPIGLPVGTNDPAEIAVSVAAQLLERRDARAKAAGAT